MVRVRRPVSRWKRSWMYERGARLYWGDPHCLVCLVDRFGKPSSWCSSLPLHPEAEANPWELVEGAVEMLLKKDEAARAATAGAVTLVDVKMQKAQPTLWLYLTQSQWEDGSPRATSGLTVFVQDGLFKGLLKENEQSLCLWVAAASFNGLLDALEAALNTPSPDWRVDRRAGGGVAKKPKK